MMAEITARDASQRFTISIGHLARLARAGTFQKARHFGPMWVFDEDELAEWMQNRPKVGGARPGAGRKPKAEEASNV